MTRSLHPLHRRLLAVQHAASTPDAESVPASEASPASPAEIAAAEALLGRPLPPGYRRFLEEVGRACWPVDVGSVALYASADGDWPSWFVPFASDLGENLWGFDVRRKRGKELPIELWNHEEPELEDEPGTPTRFEDWLEERIEDEEASLLERRTSRTASPGAERRLRTRPRGRSRHRPLTMTRCAKSAPRGCSRA